MKKLILIWNLNRIANTSNKPVLLSSILRLIRSVKYCRSGGIYNVSDLYCKHNFSKNICSNNDVKNRKINLFLKLSTKLNHILLWKKQYSNNIKVNRIKLVIFSLSKKMVPSIDWMRHTLLDIYISRIKISVNIKKEIINDTFTIFRYKTILKLKL